MKEEKQKEKGTNTLDRDCCVDRSCAYILAGTTQTV